MDNIIKLDNINKSYDENKILIDLNLEVKEGEFVSIIGDSGSGKTTLLNVVGLMDTKDSGSYLFNNIEINKQNSEFSKIRSKEIGFVFQSYHLISYLTVVENILLPEIYSNNKKNDLIISDKDELIKEFNLEGLINKKVKYLSGGEKQRVALARALIMNPKLIICDEPTGNLDSMNTSIIIETLKKQNKMGKTILLVTHDLNIANQATTKYELKGGRLHEYI